MGKVLFGAEDDSGAGADLAGGEFGKEVFVSKRPDAHTAPGKFFAVPVDLGSVVPNGMNMDEALGCEEAGLILLLLLKRLNAGGRGETIGRNVDVSLEIG